MKQIYFKLRESIQQQIVGMEDIFHLLVLWKV